MASSITGSSQSLNAHRFVVTLEGHPQSVAEQLRLLPLSRNILCLPPLEWTPPQLPQSAEGDVKPQASVEQIRESVLKLHSEHVERAERARIFLEGQRQVGDAERRIVFYHGGVASAKKLCLKGIQSSFDGKEAKDPEKIWEEILKGGVQGLVPEEEHEAERRPETPESSAHRSSWKMERRRGSKDSPLDDGTKHAQSTESRKNSAAGLAINLNPASPTSPLSPGPRSPTLDEIAAGITIGKASVVTIRSRGNTITKHGPSASLPAIPSPAISQDAGSERPSNNSSPGVEVTKRDDARGQKLRLFPADPWSNGNAIPTPPASAGLRSESFDDLEDMGFHESTLRSSRSYRRKGSAASASTRSASPTPSSQADVSGATILPSPRYQLMPFALEDIDESIDVESLFPPLEEDMIIHLAHETTSDELLERFLKEMDLQTRKSKRQTLVSNQFTIDMQSLAENVRQTIHNNNSGMHSPKSQSQFSPRASSFASSRLPAPITRIVIRQSIETQNDIRAVIAKCIPAASTTAAADDVVGWLFDDEDHLWRPMLAGPETSDDLLPGIDLIVAIGSDGRERRNNDSPEEVRKAGELADLLSESVEDLGRRGSRQSRAVRIGLRSLIKIGLPYIVSHPAATMQDFAKGKFLLASLDYFISQNPHSRLIIIDFDLSTGSDAMLTLKHILPQEVFKIATIGDAIVPLSTDADTKRIYVRTSVGKTTTSFSVLPSPIAKSPRPVRKQTSVMRLMAVADWVLGPRTTEESLVGPVTRAEEAIKARWRVLGRWEIRRVVTPPVPIEQERVQDHPRERVQDHPRERVQDRPRERVQSVVTLKAPIPPPKDEKPVEANGCLSSVRRGSNASKAESGSLRRKEVGFADSVSDVVIVERSPSPPEIDRTEISYYEEDEEDEDYERLEEQRQRDARKKAAGKHPSKAMRWLGLE